MAHTIHSGSGWSTSSVGGTTAGAQNSTLDNMAGINTTAGSDIYEGMSTRHTIPISFSILAMLALSSLIVGLLQRRAARLRLQGRTAMRVGPWMFDIRAAERASPGSAQTMREQTEQSILEAIEMLPCSQWQAENEAECSLCMDVFQKHETIMRLPCSHAFHQSCCRKWLVEAQKYKPRRCPLCNSDPLATRHLETVAVAAPVVASDAASQVEIGQSPAASPMGV